MKNIQLENAVVLETNIAEVNNTPINADIISIDQVITEGIEIARVNVDGSITSIYSPELASVEDSLSNYIKKDQIISDIDNVKKDDTINVIAPKVISQLSDDLYGKYDINSISAQLSDIFLIKAEGYNELIEGQLLHPQQEVSSSSIKYWKFNGTDRVRYKHATTPQAVIEYVENEISTLSNTIADEYVTRHTQQLNIDGQKSFTNSNNIFNASKISVKELSVNTTIELYNSNKTPHIDFHYNNSSADYTSRIIESKEKGLNIVAENGVNISNKLYIAQQEIQPETWTFYKRDGGSIKKQVLLQSSSNSF